MWTKVKRSVVDKVPAKFIPSSVLLPTGPPQTRLAPAEVLRRRAAYLQVLKKERHYVAVAKPPGTICQDEDASSIQHHMRIDLPRLFGRPQAPFHHPKSVHRLDKAVTGALLFGTSVYGTRELSKIFHNRHMVKGYLALLCVLEGEASPIERLDSGRIIETDQETAWTVLARLRQDRDGPITYLCWLRPLQGRKHQLRIHAAVNLKAPVLFEHEDVARVNLQQFRRPGYFRKSWGEGIGLHCASMTFTLGLDRHVVTCMPPNFGIWEEIRQSYGIDWQEVIEQGQLWRPSSDDARVEAPMTPLSKIEREEEEERQNLALARRKAEEEDKDRLLQERERDRKRDVLDLILEAPSLARAKSKG